MNWTTFTTIAFLVVAVSSGCAESQPETAKKPSGPPAAKVQVAAIEATALPEVRRFLGDVRNAESAVLAAGGAGTVTRVEVLEGDQVKRGQVLVQLDDSIQRARLREAQAGIERTTVELDQAQRDVDRFGKLTEKGFHPSSQTEQISSRKDALEVTAQGQQASVQRLREEIAQMRVVAPFDGVVARRHVSRGQWLQVGEPAIELSSNGTLEVFVRVPAEVLDALSTERPAEIVRGANRTDAEVAGIVGSLDRRTRTALLRIVPTQPVDWLRQGDSVDAILTLNRENVGVVVPSDAVVQGVAGTRVFRVKDGKAEPHDVRVVARSGDQVLIEAADLKLADNIVIRGNERLRPGQDVQVQP
ncbi:MAG: efflux RND transporter periplasmic adaptor subunit [bacterium]